MEGTIGVQDGTDGGAGVGSNRVRGGDSVESDEGAERVQTYRAQKLGGGGWLPAAFIYATNVRKAAKYGMAERGFCGF